MNSSMENCPVFVVSGFSELTEINCIMLVANVRFIAASYGLPFLMIISYPVERVMNRALVYSTNTSVRTGMKPRHYRFKLRKCFSCLGIFSASLAFSSLFPSFPKHFMYISTLF